jgi:tetratricopeptide (TPR) repeat protein
MENFYTKIEDYIKGKLPPSEKAQFEKQVLLDTDLANELAMKRLELESYELLVENTLRRNMSEWQKERKTMLVADDKPTLLRLVRSNVFQWATAASILLIAGIFYLKTNTPTPNLNDVAQKDTIIVKPKNPLIDTTNPSKIVVQETKNKKPKPVEKNNSPQVPTNTTNESQKPLDKQNNNEEVLAIVDVEEFITPPDFEASVRGASRGAAQDSMFSIASTLLQSEQYKKAESLLLSIEKDNEVKLYLAYAYLKTKDFDKALLLLEYLSKNKNFNLVERAEWYLVLTYISKGERSLANPLLKKIVEDIEHPFNKSAIKLLDKLK